MLDTNIVIYVIKRRPIEILEVFNAHAGQMCISSITLAELLHGVEKSSMVTKNLRMKEIMRPKMKTKLITPISLN